jgi:hypothetical protein
MMERQWQPVSEKEYDHPQEELCIFFLGGRGFVASLIVRSKRSYSQGKCLLAAHRPTAKD